MLEAYQRNGRCEGTEIPHYDSTQAHERHRPDTAWQAKKQGLQHCTHGSHISSDFTDCTLWTPRSRSALCNVRALAPSQLEDRGALLLCLTGKRNHAEPAIRQRTYIVDQLLRPAAGPIPVPAAALCRHSDTVCLRNRPHGGLRAAMILAELIIPRVLDAACDHLTLASSARNMVFSVSRSFLQQVSAVRWSCPWLHSLVAFDSHRHAWCPFQMLGPVRSHLCIR